MAGKPRGLFRNQIRLLFDVGTAAGLTDGQLLERFATRRDEGAELAFAALVERHGPMVLRACRGILRDDHEALDAFQATFLVLARKSGSLWVRDSLGPWLHRVACHAAGRAKRAAARRRAIETRAAEMAEHRSRGDVSNDLAAILHEEVNRLPERFRSAIVLCDLEGRTCEEAARHLGCPVGTVGSRLSRGRQRLRDRLSRRGVAGAGTAALWTGPSVSLPPGLVDSTAVAAVRFVSLQAVHQGAAVSLAQGLLRTMVIIRGWKLATVACAVGALMSGVIALAERGEAPPESRAEDTPRAALAADVPVTEVKSGTIRFVVDERGSLESANNLDVFCKVEGQATIISLVPEGTRVSRGDVVCELDSAPLRDQLTNQRITTEGAKAAYQNAKLSREVAEIAVNEYVDGIYPKDLQAAVNEVELTRSSIARAEERLKRTMAARDRLNAILNGQGGTKTPAEIVAALDLEDRLAAADQALDREQRALEIARARRDVVEKFTRDKTVAQLRVEVEKSRAVELARQQAWDLEQKKEKKLEVQIANCKLLAPGNGMMVHANDPSRFGGNPVQIEEGAVVRERQKIFSIPDISRLRVNTKVHESIVDRVRPGLRARILVDAFADQVLTGTVDDVSPLPDPRGVFSSDVKVYTTHVSIDKGLPGLRPGMTVLVEILVAERDNALSVPVEAVVRYDEKDHVGVKTPDGSIDWRAVTLGMADARHVEVKAGLKAGERVVLEPLPLLDEEQKRTMSPTPAQATARTRTLRNQGVPAALRAKVLKIPPEERARLQGASPEEARAILRKAGFNEVDIRQFDAYRQPATAPR